MSSSPQGAGQVEGAARDLPGGLRVRWATPAEAERVAAFNGYVFRHEEHGEISARTYNQTLDMMSGSHPLIAPDDFAVVEDLATGEFVASTCLLKQVWTYEGVSFAVGRPEFVATRQEYRNRGLVRALFALIHERSDGRGDLAQGITGIPYFYRQFGYEFAADLEFGRTVYATAIPVRDGEAPEPYWLEPATEVDLPFIQDLYERRRHTWLISSELRLDFLEFAHKLATENRAPNWQLHTIRGEAGARCGYVRTNADRWDRNFVVWDVAVTSGTALSAVAPPVLRALVPLGEAAPASRPSAGTFSALHLLLGREDPFYDVLGDAVALRVMEPYAWYIRVPNLVRLIALVRPVLERRLAGSPFAGHTGELRLNFYRGGLRLVLEAGRLAAVEPWRQPAWGSRAQASFPPLVFYQVLFGFRSIAELRDSLTDVRVDAEVASLLDALFPKRLSRLDFWD